MTNQTSRNIRLGAMVLLGFIFLSITMYIIGDKQNLFGSTFQISANFKNVNGLTEGNSVRLAGMNVGTVVQVEIVNDSTVKVDLIIENKYQNFIKKNAIVSVGTDGLMGNKLVNINSLDQPSIEIQEGDILSSSEPLKTEVLFKTLGQTNDDIAVIAKNLKIFSVKMNDPNSFWGLLSDTVVSNTVSHIVRDIQQSSQNTIHFTEELALIVSNVNSGKGSIGQLLKDTTFSIKLYQTMTNLQNVSDSLIHVAGNIQVITDKVTNGNGAITTIFTDTTFDNNLNETMKNLKRSSETLDENLEALKHNILFRKYFKKQAKKMKE